MPEEEKGIAMIETSERKVQLNDNRLEMAIVPKNHVTLQMTFIDGEGVKIKNETDWSQLKH